MRKRSRSFKGGRNCEKYISCSIAGFAIRSQTEASDDIYFPRVIAPLVSRVVLASKIYIDTCVCAAISIYVYEYIYTRICGQGESGVWNR